MERTYGFFNSRIENHILKSIMLLPKEDRFSEACRIRREIINNPRQTLYRILRMEFELQLGIKNPEKVFNPYILTQLKNWLATNPNLGDITMSEAERNTPAALPALLAAYGASVLSASEAWQTKKFRKQIRWDQKHGIG